MTNSLKENTIKGVLWSFIEKFGSKLIVLITQIILARLLSPEDFGLIGMLIIFIFISQVFVDSGFGNALIQKTNVEDKDYSTVFICNIITSCILYIILFFSSPYIADFFKIDQLIPLLRLLGFVLIFDSFSVVHFAKLRRELNFKLIAKSTLLANALAAIVGLTLAFFDYGVLSLVFQMLCTSFLRTVFFWIYSSWSPSLIFCKTSFKSLFSFSYKLLISGLLDQIFQNIYMLIIGKLYSAKDLGYYTQAKNFQQVPVTTLASIVGSVTFPAFAKIKDDNVKLLIGLKKTIKLLVFINFPLMIGLAIVAHPLFLYVLGEKWLSSVPYFQLLCISGMLYTLQTTNLSLLQVKGRTDLYLKLEIIKKILIVIGILIGVNWGVIGLVWSRVICSFLSYFVNSYYSGSLANYPVLQQVKDLIPTLLITLIMSASMISLGILFDVSILVFISQLIIGCLVYFSISYYTKQEAMIDAIKIIKKLIPIKNGK